MTRQTMACLLLYGLWTRALDWAGGGPLAVSQQREVIPHGGADSCGIPRLLIWVLLFLELYPPGWEGRGVKLED